VLVADPDEALLTLARMRLERAGYEVLVARDGVEALTCARAERPDLCVLDVMMPRLSGYDVTRQLREHVGTSAIRVILLTAVSRDGAGAPHRGFDSGADDYIRKPFSAQELRARVQTVLAQREPARAVAAL
jgi:DNA-binding response OmpR family regulator